MKEIEAEEWQFNHDMPHEALMDKRGLDVWDLSAGLQRQVSLFNETFNRAIEDGYINEQEENELIAISYKIAEAIQKEHPEDETGITGLGIFAGALLTIGALLGLRQLTKS